MLKKRTHQSSLNHGNLNAALIKRIKIALESSQDFAANLPFVQNENALIGLLKVDGYFEGIEFSGIVPYHLAKVV